jgi:hypothetical protein
VLDQGLRSADLIAGPDGATVLALNREHLLALCEDDAVLGTRLLWNISSAVAGRARFILWQLERATQRSSLEAARRAQQARSYEQAEEEARRLIESVGVGRE